MKRKKQRSRLKKLSWLTLLVLVGVGAAVYLYFLHNPASLYPTPSADIPQNHQQSPSLSAQNRHPGKPSRPFDIPPKLGISQGIDGKKPFIAIVIDDMGYRDENGVQMLAVNLNLSFAFLPFAPHTADQAAIAHDLGRDILLHLPLEPTDRKWEPGPGTLFLSMNARQRNETFLKDLAAVPMAIGVNNHMGSRFTEDRAAMKNLLQHFRANNLFFLDSLTTPNSVGYSLAKEMGVEAIRRNIFLDNEQDKDKIVSQLEKLIRIAEKQGFAVGIAHPHKETIMALMEYKDKLNKRVNLVGIHSLLEMNE